MDAYDPEKSLASFKAQLGETIEPSETFDTFDIALLVVSGQGLPDSYPVVDFKGIGDWCTDRSKYSLPFRTTVVGIDTRHPSLQIAEIIAN